MMEPTLELMAAVISQAVTDYKAKIDPADLNSDNERVRSMAQRLTAHKRCAERFFAAGGGIEDYCAVLGLDADYIRQQLKKA